MAGAAVSWRCIGAKTARRAGAAAALPTGRDFGGEAVDRRMRPSRAVEQGTVKESYATMAEDDVRVLIYTGDGIHHWLISAM
ncbi:MAG: hypothetical protein ACREE9_10045 [Stellaceae bacterium]